MAAFCVTKVKGPEGLEELATENIAWVDGGELFIEKNALTLKEKL